MRKVSRSYPDSAERNHLEPGWEVRWHRDFAGGALGFETEGVRRTTGGRASTSGDDFWDERSAVEGEWSTLSAGTWRARLEGEAIQYDREDTTLFFDYQIVRVFAGPRFLAGTSWSLGVGPRVEWFLSPRDPGERYRELAGQLEFEWFGGGAWWNLSPAAGWRAYDSGANAGTEPGLHSSYGFGELLLFGDQPVAGGWRVRALGNGRAEFHTDSAEDARSLYFSLDVRKIF